LSKIIKGVLCGKRITKGTVMSAERMGLRGGETPNQRRGIEEGGEEVGRMRGGGSCKIGKLGTGSGGKVNLWGGGAARAR